MLLLVLNFKKILIIVYYCNILNYCLKILIIYDLTTRLRNANLIKAPYVRILNSNLAYSVLEVLKEEGFLDLSCALEKDRIFSKHILVSLKYNKSQSQRYITGITRISTCGQRVYCKSKSLPKVLGGVGVAVLLIEVLFI